MQFLKGKKTFIVSGLTLAYVLVGFYLGQGFNSELFVLALTGAGLRDALNPTK